MSLNRLIFYSGMIGGWAAFVGWFLSELLLFRRSFPDGWWGFVVIMLAAALVGGCIAGGLSLLGGVASGSLKGQLHRFLPGFLCGLVGGAIGSALGNAIFLVVPHLAFRLVGWCLMGLAIGSGEGIYDKSFKKLRNGLIGGGLGGLMGGLFFSLLGGASMADRAIGFVILGLCIGFFIGLAQVILKEAWLTVEAGFRPGRQLVLSMPETIMGTSEKAALPFIAFGAKGVEPIHARIMHQADGSYLLQDNHSRTGTFVNRQPVHGALVLRNNDTIQLGVNLVRFREVHRAEVSENPRASRSSAGGLERETSPAVPVSRPSVIKPRAERSESRALPTAPPASAIRPPARPAAPAPAPPLPTVTAAAPATPGCPICSRAGVAVPQSNKRRCTSCGILY